MAFPLDDILLGPDSFGELHRLDGMIWHTGEEPGVTRAYAVATATWQLSNPGSYNFRIYDRASDPRGVMLNVPWRWASGGINPSGGFWSPRRFAFLERELARAGPCPRAGCPGPFGNPTLHHLQVSFVGRTALLEAGGGPANYVDDARALIAWAEAHPDRGPAPLVQSKHAHWQTNRTDPGAVMYAQLVTRIPPDTAVDLLLEDPMLKYKRQTWRTGPSGALIYEKPSTSSPRIASIAGGRPVTSIGQTLDFAWRAVLTAGPKDDQGRDTLRIGYARRADLRPDETPGPEAFDDGELAFTRLLLSGGPVPAGGMTPDELAAAKFAAADDVARAASRAAHAYRPS